MDIQLSDLVADCQKCGGNGDLGSPGGQYQRSLKVRPCDECRGSGKKLTAAGRVFRDFSVILRDRDLLSRMA